MEMSSCPFANRVSPHAFFSVAAFIKALCVWVWLPKQKRMRRGSNERETKELMVTPIGSGPPRVTTQTPVGKQLMALRKFFSWAGINMGLS